MLDKFGVSSHLKEDPIIMNFRRYHSREGFISQATKMSTKEDPRRIQGREKIREQQSGRQKEITASRVFI